MSARWRRCSGHITRPIAMRKIDLSSVFRVTLHMFGLDGDVIVTMSDGRTSRNSKVATNEARKATAFPSADAYPSGGLAAILLVSGRAEFPTEDASPSAQSVKIDAITAIENFLAGEMRSFGSLQELVDAIWDEVVGPLYWVCGDCVDERHYEAGIYGSDFNGESTCKAHNSRLTLTAVGFDPSQDGRGAVYVRTWVEGVEAKPLRDGVIEFDSEIIDQPLVYESTFKQDELHRAFLARVERLNGDWFAGGVEEVRMAVDDVEREARLATIRTNSQSGLTEDERAAELASIASKLQSELDKIALISTVAPVGGRITAYRLDRDRIHGPQLVGFIEDNANDGAPLIDGLLD